MQNIDTRLIDNLGRIVLPIEAIRKIGVSKSEPLNIAIDNDKIILYAASPSCQICKSTEHVFKCSVGNICVRCAQAIGDTPISNRI